MDQISYSKVRGRCFRLTLRRRLSTHRLRIKFLYLYKLFSRWRALLVSLKEGAPCHPKRRVPRDAGSNSSRRHLVTQAVINRSGCVRHRSFGRSNSFYSEAIADCLEFIKRSSVSLEDYKKIDQI